jgi:FkbM family methyltransferase
MNILKRATRKLLLSVLPPSKRLSIKHWFYLNGDSYENELKYIEKILPERRGCAVDAGANEGFYSYALSKYFTKVYAFELNDDLSKGLTDCASDNIEVIHEGLSSEFQDATLYIPIQKGRPLTGWASLAPGNCPGISEHLEKAVKVRPLDSLGLLNVSFMKIDVEGHELEVLKGAEQIIQNQRPYVLVEIKDQNLVAVFSFFEQIGYKCSRLSDFVDHAPSHENYIFTPIS